MLGNIEINPVAANKAKRFMAKLLSKLVASH
jgi:hypothetical protein